MSDIATNKTLLNNLKADASIIKFCKSCLSKFKGSPKIVAFADETAIQFEWENNEIYIEFVVFSPNDFSVAVLKNENEWLLELDNIICRDKLGLKLILKLVNSYIIAYNVF